MSNPPNILADFHTYSYHHILIVCEGYNTAAALSRESDLQAFRRDTSDLYAPRFLNNNPDYRYVTLIDSATDVKFSLKTVKWETILVPRRESTPDFMQYANTIEVDGEMEIVEPYGIDFYNVLSNITRDLDRDPSAVVYLLKTIFVGQTDQGVEEVISTVRPFIFNMINITSEIDNTGTTYKLTLVGSSNGMAKMPQHASIGEKISLVVEAEDTVASMMAKLEKEVNNKYQKYKANLFAALEAAGNSTDDLTARFQDVYYSFRTDDVYAQPEYQVGTTTGAIEQDEQGVTRISSGSYGTLETLIQRIIGSCQQCDDDGSGKNSDNQRYFHNIISYPVENPDKYEVRHVIRRYKNTTQDKDGNPIDPTPGEFIEFDYMFTGKNIDVLEFDIKMDMGLAFFYTIANARDLPVDQGESIEGVNNIKDPARGPSTGGSGSQDPSDKKQPQERRRAPLFLGTDIKDPFIKNRINPLSAASYDAMLTNHARLEHVEAFIKIAGNPNLLDEIINTTGVGVADPAEGNTGAFDVTRTPALVKVNVKFPNSNEFNIDAAGVGSAGVKDFWYRGFYRMFSIENSFSDGLFIQNIRMFSLPVTDSNDVDKNTPTKQTPFIPTPDIPPVAGRPCVFEPFPYHIIQSIENIPGASGGYTAETNEFIRRVEEMADNLSTLPEWLLAVMSFETGGSFSPTQTNPNSSATGLIQFLPSTAVGLGTTIADLVQMTALEQLDVVEAYFAQPQYRGKLNTLEQVYTAVLSGTPRENINTVLFSAPSRAYRGNAGLDYNNDGNITVGEASTLVATRLFGNIIRITQKLKNDKSISEASRAGITRGRLDQNLLNAIGDYQNANGLQVTFTISDEFGRHLFGLPLSSYEDCETDSIYTDPTYPRNQRNNNPLNIEKTVPGLKRWEGEITGDDKRFAKFSSPLYGLRAAYILLRRTYLGRDGLNTIDLIINKWAPVDDNSVEKVENYIKAVSNEIGVGPNTPLSIGTSDEQLIALARAMARHEGGRDFVDYDDSVYWSALALYPR